jgi:D-3-phosphoglycerate dehydrogenase
MKVIIQRDLFLRSCEAFSVASEEHGIQFIQTDVLDEGTMLKHHKEGVNCIVIGAEAYSHKFYNSLREGTAVIRYGVGYNAVPIDICLRRNIKVGYTPDTLTDSVAEHTFALLLGVARKIPKLNQSMQVGKWEGLTGVELKNKTIAVIGYGKIGQSVAKIAKWGFGMKVSVFDKKEINDSSSYSFSNNFSEVVKDADIITIHLASYPETKGFINREKIDMMKNGAILINTARGELVEEKDLYEALKCGKISAAGIDVFEKEPYQPNSKYDFRKLTNVVLTPHCGSNTVEASNRIAEMVIKNILAFYSSFEMVLIPEMSKTF